MRYTTIKTLYDNLCHDLDSDPQKKQIIINFFKDTEAIKGYIRDLKSDLYDLIQVFDKDDPLVIAYRESINDLTEYLQSKQKEIFTAKTRPRPAQREFLDRYSDADTGL